MIKLLKYNLKEQPPNHIDKANTQYALSFDGPDSSSAIFDIQTTSNGFNVNFKLEYSATSEMPHQAASLSLSKSF